MASCFYQNPVFPSENKLEEQEDDNWLYLPFNTSAAATSSTVAKPLSPPHGKKELEQSIRPHYASSRRALSFSKATPSPYTSNVWHSLWSNPTWQNTKISGKKPATSSPSMSRAATAEASHAFSLSDMMLTSPRYGVTTAPPTTAEDGNEYFGTRTNHPSNSTFSSDINDINDATINFNFNESPFPSPLSTSTTVHAATNGTNASAASLRTSILHERRQSCANIQKVFNNKNDAISEWPAEYTNPAATSPTSSSTTTAAIAMTAVPPNAPLGNQSSREERRHSIAVSSCTASYFDYAASPFSTPFAQSYQRFLQNAANHSSNSGYCRDEGLLYYNLPLTPPSYPPAAGAASAPSLLDPTDTTLSSVHQRQHLPQIQQKQIDDYFSPASTASTATINTTMQQTQELTGKGIRLDLLDPDQTLYKVQFKCNHRSGYYYISKDNKSMAEDDVNVKDWVVVDGDRGQDFGQVMRTFLVADYNANGSNNSSDVTSTTEQSAHHRHSGSNAMYAKRIIRVATAADLAAYNSLGTLEERALIYCQGLIAEKGLKMEVLSAEFQWDRRKLTFYFSSNEQRVDFRELVHDLFKTYKTRIWMCQLNHQQQQQQQ